MRWVVYMVAIVAMLVIAIVCLPWVIMWCLLFDPD